MNQYVLVEQDYRVLVLVPFSLGHLQALLLTLLLLLVSRLDRLRRDDDVKGRQTKKAQEVEQSLLSKVCFDGSYYSLGVNVTGKSCLV